MKTLAVLSRKGGTGKTTLAIHLAVEAERTGHTTVLIDLDPQASAGKWNDHREGDTPFVVTSPPSRLPEILGRAKEGGATLAILDTAPHTETAALDAANAAEMALIPVQAGTHRPTRHYPQQSMLSGSRTYPHASFSTPCHREAIA